MKIIIFENDADFEFFALVPITQVKKEDNKTYSDWDFTDEYKNEVDNGTWFYIKDKKSNIIRRNACTCDIITKPVKNVKPYNPLIVNCNNPKIEIINYTEK